MAKVIGIWAWIQFICLIIVGFITLEVGIVYSIFVWIIAVMSLILLKALQEHLNNQKIIIHLLGGNENSFDKLPDEPEIVRSSKIANHNKKGKIIR